MKNRFALILLLTIWTNSSFAQSDSLFEISEFVFEEGFERIKKKYLRKKDSVFFEDELYTVRKTCRGEWGGSIWFKHKVTGKEYSCTATCPVSVNKIGDKYIVTSTLAHMNGSSEITEIADPAMMEEFQLPEPIIRNGEKVRRAGYRESKSTQGTTQLIDTFGVLTLASFQLSEDLFHIVTDFKKTFVAKIENDELVTIDTLSNESIWTYEPEVIRTKDSHLVVFFENSETKGYLEIYGNKIILRKYE